MREEIIENVNDESRSNESDWNRYDTHLAEWDKQRAAFQLNGRDKKKANVKWDEIK